MAGDDAKKTEKVEKTVTKETKVVRPKDNNHKQKQKKNWKKEKKEIKKEVKKEVKKEDGGPKARISQTISATLAVVDGINEQGPVLSIAAFTNPGLIKAHGDDTAFGPLQANAAQFSLWRVKNMSITATPMVGSSAVSGTIARLSLNMAQTPGATSWGGLGARTHRDLAAGRSLHWKIRDQDLAGPRKGGYWFTDMNMEGGQSGGAVFEMHCFGQTQSTYQDKAWEGPLWIVEIKATWQFANYNSAPALGTLERVEEKVQPSFSGSAGTPLVMELPTGSTLARFMTEPHTSTGRAAGADVGETIYQVVDTGLGVVSTVTPPPFNWLIKGGWWFVKKLFGRANRAGASQYYVYASLADAQNNKPAILSSAVSGQPTVTNLQVTQLNAPNTGPNTAGTFAGVPPVPVQADTFNLIGSILPIVRDAGALINDNVLHFVSDKTWLSFENQARKEHQTFFLQHHQLLDPFLRQEVLEPNPVGPVRGWQNLEIGTLLAKSIEPGGVVYFWKGTTDTPWVELFDIQTDVSTRQYGTNSVSSDTSIQWWSSTTPKARLTWLTPTPRENPYFLTYVLNETNWTQSKPAGQWSGWTYIAGPICQDTRHMGAGVYGQFTVPATRKDKLRELLRKLEADEIDLSDSDSDFEEAESPPVTKLETPEQARYEEYRALGLSHEQATKLVELKGCDLVP